MMCKLPKKRLTTQSNNLNRNRPACLGRFLHVQVDTMYCHLEASMLHLSHQKSTEVFTSMLADDGVVLALRQLNGGYN
jgi:hypothetical protein